MVTFFGNGQVWDKQTGKVLGRFTDGRWETSDPVVAGKLAACGFACEGELPAAAPDTRLADALANVDTLTVDGLDAMAEDLGIEFEHGAKKADKVTAIKTFLAADFARHVVAGTEG